MPVKNYVNVNGRTIAEHTGGVRTAYLTDALGSVTATVNSSQVVVNTYRWKPYGSLLAKTGAGADPTLGWVGTYGYRRTQRSRSEYYMLARHYDAIGGRWTTVDALWPYELAYRYALCSPADLADPTGTIPWIFRVPPPLRGRSDEIPIPFIGGRLTSPPVRLPPILEVAPVPGTQPRGNHSNLVRSGPAGAVTVVVVEIAAVAVTLVALADLGRYACTGQTGLFTTIGSDYGNDLYDTGETSTTPLYLRSLMPKRSSKRYPRNCKEAGRLVHRLCDLGKTSPPNWNKGSGWRDREHYCMEVRNRMSRAKDCYLARLLQEKLCGKKGSDGKIDDTHWDQIRDHYDNWIDGLRLFNEFRCYEFL